MSLTSSERRALAWLLALVVTGAGVQIMRSWRDAGAATVESSAALRLQLVAVDSAQRVTRRRDRSAGRSSRGGQRARTLATTSDPPDPVSPSAESGVRTGAGAARMRARRAQLPRLESVDVDRADSALLERLPRIGPALAARIVADRNQRGPFGSLTELQRVRGIGPKVAAGLASIVTFSGIQRPSAVQH